MQTITLQVDDLYYKKPISQIGQDNLIDFFVGLSKPYLWLNKKSNTHQNTPSRLKVNKTDDFSFVGAFDEFFGILSSDKSVDLKDMSDAITMRDSQSW